LRDGSFLAPGFSRIRLRTFNFKFKRKNETAIRINYHILGKDHTVELYEYLSRDGQLLLPLVELLENVEMAADELIDIKNQ